MTRILTLFAALWALMPSAFGETLGTITAAIDGEEKTWYVNAAEGQSQSDWTQVMPNMLSMSSFSLWGNPSQDQVASVKDVLMIGFTVVKGPSGMTPTGVEVQYLVNGFGDQWLAVEEDPPELTLSRIEQAGDGVEVAGSFSARLYHSTDMRGQEVDRSQSKTVSGRFEATLQPR